MKKILVIEDEVEVLNNIEEILEIAEYKVITANNGRKGLELAKIEAPNLIICDIMMPELDGYGVLTALREDKATASIPVIFLTAKTERFDQRLGMELGADDYLTKPFLSDELLGAIAARFARQEALEKYFKVAQEASPSLAQKIRENSTKLAQVESLVKIKDELLKKISEELRDPLSNINMAIKMLENAVTDEQREKYMKILQSECDREIKVLNEVAELQELLTPDKAQILQRYNLINFKH